MYRHNIKDVLMHDCMHFKCMLLYMFTCMLFYMTWMLNSFQFKLSIIVDTTNEKFFDIWRKFLPVCHVSLKLKQTMIKLTTKQKESVSIFILVLSKIKFDWTEPHHTCTIWFISYLSVQVLFLMITNLIFSQPLSLIVFYKYIPDLITFGKLTQHK